jgi:hypothetical protein
MDIEQIAAQYIAAAMEHELDKVVDHARFMAEKNNDPRLLEMLMEYVTSEHVEIRRKLDKIMEEHNNERRS